MLPQVGDLVGRPWEIHRTSGLTKRYPHTVDVYAKDGGIPGYLSRFALVDEYGIGIVALTAGLKGVLDSATEGAMSLFVEAVDEEARKQAQAYVGNYSTTTTDLGCVEVQMGIDIDDGPGLSHESDEERLGYTRGDSDTFHQQSCRGEWSLFDGVEDISYGDLAHGSCGRVRRRRGVGGLAVEPMVFDVKSGLPSEGIFRDALASWSMLESLLRGRSVDVLSIAVRKANHSKLSSKGSISSGQRSWPTPSCSSILSHEVPSRSLSGRNHQIQIASACTL